MEKKIFKSAVRGTITAPSSKSYAQRALAASLLAEGTSVLNHLELCSDTQAAFNVIQAFGADCVQTSATTYEITGGLKLRNNNLNVNESGLSARMFIPIASLFDVKVRFDGTGTLLDRPFDMIIDPLRDLGVAVESYFNRLPIAVKGPLKGGKTTVDGSVSSQFTSGLLMALPLAQKETTFKVTEAISTPYIDMTLDVLDKFGIEVDMRDYREFYIQGNQKFVPRSYNIEGDWSGASCLLVAGALYGEVTIENLNPLSKQADVKIINALYRAGAKVVTTSDSVTVCRPEELTGFSFDATDCPDLFPALAALASGCVGETIITGTDRLKHKESDRAQTIRREFSKFDATVDLSMPNTMKITPPKTITGAQIDTHGDHRIAMATTVAGLGCKGATVIHGAETVAKSYPAFWRDLESLLIKE